VRCPRRSLALPHALVLCVICACVWSGVVGATAGPAAVAFSAPGFSAAREIDGGTQLSGISCPSSGLCVAVDGAGRALVGTPPDGGATVGAWSAPFSIDASAGLTSVACVSSALCVAVDDAGQALLSTSPRTVGSSSWSQPFAIPGAGALSAVACASSTLCVAVDREGRVALSTTPGVAGSWSQAVAIPGVGALSALACPSGTLCAAVDDQGHLALSTDPAAGRSTWHVRLLDPSPPLTSISCAASGSCVALDGGGNALASPNAAATAVSAGAPGSGATWSSTAIDVFGSPAAVSCTGAGPCVAVDGAGYALASENPALVPPAWVASGIDAQPATALTGVSCAPEGLCAAVDARGRVFTALLPLPAAVSSLSEAALVQPHPSITGTPAPGQTLTCASGVSTTGVTLTYAWLRDSRTIAGAGAPTYGVGGQDVSHHLQCRVTATTTAGSLSATSAFVTVPAGGVGTISETTVGTPRAGHTAVRVPLTCSRQAAGRCTIRLRLTVRETLRGSRVVAVAASGGTRHVTATVGARTLRLRPGQNYTATVALNSAGLHLLAHLRRMSVRLSVSGTVVGVISAALKSATLTLTATAKLSKLGRPATATRPSRSGAHAHGAAATTAAGGLAPTPYMGWDTYFTFGGHFDEASVLEQASRLLTLGLASRGYRYVWLDAGWWQGARDATGAIAVNRGQWPHGMAWLASTLHAAGLKVGLYTDAGSVGCGGPGQGSYGHYQQDVNTFAAWGFDAVKVDFCGGVRQGLAPAAAYSALHAAIVHNASRRPLLLSICDFLQPGQFAPEVPAFASSAFTSYTFGPSSGNSWRTNTDLGVPGDVRFASVLRNLDADAAQPQAAGPGHWNDPDYLGPDQGMNAAQFRTQLSMWAMLAAPLMLSANLISLSAPSAAALANREVIAIDQDPAGLQARLLATSAEAQVWVKPLSDGSRAIALLNRGSGTLRIATSAVAAGLPAAGGYAVRNVWSGALTSLRSPGAIAANVAGNSTVLLRVFAR
jgi:Alpha galactosidase A/Alpha galactosidase C-terminal beta sandwich domain